MTFIAGIGLNSGGQIVETFKPEFSSCARLHRHLRARQHHFDNRRDLDPVRVNGDMILALLPIRYLPSVLLGRLSNMPIVDKEKQVSSRYCIRERENNG